jgi:hypothetical protein
LSSSSSGKVFSPKHFEAFIKAQIDEIASEKRKREKFIPVPVRNKHRYAKCKQQNIERSLLKKLTMCVAHAQVPLQPVLYYRSFQFADSLEGTRASLMRHRKTTSPNSMPEYMPSNFNSRQQTANSILLTDEVTKTRECTVKNKH